MDNLSQAMDAARALLAGDRLDAALFSKVENYVLANGGRLAADPRMAKLRELVDEVALKFGRQPLSAAQESFGLNSCAQ